MAGVAKTCQKLLMPSDSCDLVDAGEVRPNPRWRMPPHQHPFHELIVVLDGRMKLLTGGDSLLAEAGDLLLYRSGSVHEEITDPQHPVKTYYVGFRATAGAIDRVPVRSRDTGGRIRQLAGWLVHDHRVIRTADEMESLLRALLAELRRLAKAPGEPWLAHVRQWMQHHLAERLQLGDLARAGGMSKFAFIRKFKEQSGRTPMEDLRLMRLNQARSLVLSSALPVKAIAPAVGLGDEYQLSKLFRRHFLMSPSEMRIYPRSRVKRRNLDGGMPRMRLNTREN